MKQKLGKFGGALALVAVGMLIAGAASAGTDTTFGSSTVAGPVQTLMMWLNGSLGVLISIIALAVAVISAVSGKLTQVAAAVGVAIAIQVGPSVLAGMFTATLPLIV